MTYQQLRPMLTDEKFKTAKEMANLFHLMDTNPSAVSNLDIDRIYADKGDDEYITCMAVLINKRRRHKKRR